MEAGVRGRDGIRPHTQGSGIRGDGAVNRKKAQHRLTEFRRAERRRRLRRKRLKALTAAAVAVIAVTKAYSFVSEGALSREHTQPPFTGVLESADAPGTAPFSEEESEIPAVAAGERPQGENAFKERPEGKSGSMDYLEKLVYLGEFEVTGYCDCDYCCGKKEVKLTKMETVPKPGYTVAADPEVIPLGSSIVVDGVTYRVEDIGQAVKGKSLDIFFATHQEAVEFGRQERSVYLK